jgi:hypothetical protein
VAPKDRDSRAQETGTWWSGGICPFFYLLPDDMAINIKNAEADRLARELASETCEKTV